MRSIPAIVCLVLVCTSGVFGQAERPSLEELIAIVDGSDAIKSAEAITAIGKRKLVSELAIQKLVDSLADERRAEDIPDHVLVTFPVETVGAAASVALAEIGKPAVSPICELLGKPAEKAVLRLSLIHI